LRYDQGIARASRGTGGGSGVDPAVLDETARRLKNRLRSCDICPRTCGVDRTKGERGVCRTGLRAVVSTFGPHFGEESPLVGGNGSGTVFFSGCSLRCVFCQNYVISHLPDGEEADPPRLAGIFLAVQRMGCHNLNLVTPTHVTPQIVEALGIAAAKGFSLPVVYNCGGYERVETLRELSRQVGPLTFDPDGNAVRGLLVRHLVMPGDASTTREVIDFLADGIATGTYLNLMDQYRPCGRAAGYPEIARRTSRKEWEDARAHALRKGMTRSNY